MTRLSQAFVAVLVEHPRVYDVLDALIGLAMDRAPVSGAQAGGLDIERGVTATG
ncbi:hypothetical protein [Mycolicibacterium sp. XJ1819]